MSDQGTAGGGQATARHSAGDDHHRRISGGLVFAGVLLIIVGVLDILRGLMAVVSDDIFVVTRDYAFRFNLTGWGWAHLVLGILALVVGIFVLRGARWARVVGVILTGLLLVASFLSLPYHPLWSLVLIALYAVVIWALCVHPHPHEHHHDHAHDHAHR